MTLQTYLAERREGVRTLMIRIRSLVLKRRKWWVRAVAMELIRPLVVRGVDCNEDFNCGFCSKPVLRRFLYCSTKCANLCSFGRDALLAKDGE